MPEKHQAKLQWVLVEGNLHHVSDFAHLPPHERPQALCPVCSREVRLKLGTVRVHHCAHAPHVECAATQPETALHLNTKLYLYRQLQQVHKLTVMEKCTHKRGFYGLPYNTEDWPQWQIMQYKNALACQEAREYTWLEHWDAVEIEYTIGSRRPDIALLAQGNVIGAIEVFVSHAVDEEKAAYLKGLGIPWLEIVGDEDFYTGETAWIPDTPLHIHRMQPSAWICDTCQVYVEAEEYQRKNYTDVYAARIVDFYFPSSKKFRMIYLVIQVVKDGERVEMCLIDKEGVVLATETAPITQSSVKALSQVFEGEMEKKRRQKAIVDSPMQWDRDQLPHGYDSELIAYGDIFYPRRYVWWEKEKKWFLPKENEMISWDRDEN
ncbi:MAG: competence protein CoiA family protein [Chloroflexota bacterium]